MCGRYSETGGVPNLERHFGAPAKLPDYRPRYNIAPTQSAPVVVVDDGGRVIKRMRWGLIPFWAKDIKIGHRMINARAESVSEKPAYRRSFQRQRCVVAADGFYEWQRREHDKQPFRFTLDPEAPIGFAGLWDRWKDPDSDFGELQSFTIITTTANSIARPVHDRMPVILPPETYERWLDPDLRDVGVLLAWLQPYATGAMRCYPISRLINSPANDRPECIDRSETE